MADTLRYLDGKAEPVPRVVTSVSGRANSCFHISMSARLLCTVAWACLANSRTSGGVSFCISLGTKSLEAVSFFKTNFGMSVKDMPRSAAMAPLDNSDTADVPVLYRLFCGREVLSNTGVEYLVGSICPRRVACAATESFAMRFGAVSRDDITCSTPSILFINSTRVGWPATPGPSIQTIAPMPVITSGELSSSRCRMLSTYATEGMSRMATP